MIKNLIFIEHKKDIVFFKSYFGKDTMVISMSPSVSIELEKRMVQYRSTLEFFSSSNHQEVIKHSVDIIDILRPFVNKAYSYELSDTFEKTWVYYLKFYLHYLLSTLIIVKNAERIFKPSRIIILESSFVTKAKHRPGYVNQSMYDLLRLYGKSHNLNFKCIKGFVDMTALANIRNFFIQQIKGMIFEVMIFIYPLFSKGRESIFAIDNTYNMTGLLPKIGNYINNPFAVYLLKGGFSIKNLLQDILSGASFSFIVVSSYVAPNKRKNFLYKANNVEKNIKKFIYKNNRNTIFFGVDIKLLLLAFIKNNLTKEMMLVYGEILSLHKVMRIIKPKCVLAQHSLGVSYALGEYCLKNCIPGLMIPHGSYVPYTGKVSDVEWSIHAHTMINSRYPFVALQTPLALRFLNLQKDVVSIGLKTGPLILAKEINKNNKTKNIFKSHKGKFIILHASSPREWHSFRPLIYETVDEYIQNLNDVIKTLDKSKNFFLAIRFRPISSLSLQEFKELLFPSSCYKVYSEGSFEEYLLESDLVISYSSTAIEEALSNNIPVLQYDPDERYSHISYDVINNSKDIKLPAVSTVHCKDNLLTAIQKYYNYYPNHKDIIDWSNHTIDIDNMSWVNSLFNYNSNT
jgi:hypothetical protein